MRYLIIFLLIVTSCNQKYYDNFDRYENWEQTNAKPIYRVEYRWLDGYIEYTMMSADSVYYETGPMEVIIPPIVTEDEFPYNDTIK